MERRDWERIKAIGPRQVLKQSIVPGKGVVTFDLAASRAKNGGAGRGRAAQDKRASRKLRGIRARSSKRA